MSKIIYGIYEDDDVLLNSAKHLIEKGVYISDVFSPFPIHGLDPILGIKESRLGYMAFIYGTLGLSLSLLAVWYFMIYDWPMNIGGKPNNTLLQNVSSFVPVLFEFTVLCTAHGMALTYLIRNKTLPGAKADNPDPRTTDDRFAVEIELLENQQFTQEQIQAWMSETGAIEFKEKKMNCETSCCGTSCDTSVEKNCKNCNCTCPKNENGTCSCCVSGVCTCSDCICCKNKN